MYNYHLLGQIYIGRRKFVVLQAFYVKKYVHALLLLEREKFFFTVNSAGRYHYCYVKGEASI